MSEKEELPLGQYYLTPYEILYINKLMPPGFKLEVSDVFVKVLELYNKQITKPSKPLPKRTPKIVNSNLQKTQPKMVEPEKFSFMIKANKCLDKLMKHPSSFLIQGPNTPGAPSLLDIQKKVENYELLTTEQIMTEIRKVITHYLSIYLSDNENYNKIVKLTEITEKIFKNLNNEIITGEDEMLNKQETEEKNLPFKKKNKEKSKDSSNNIFKQDTPKKKEDNDLVPMTNEEKNNLGTDIRKLSKEQLKGIVKILKDPKEKSNGNKRYFEFDINQLDTKVLRELEAYVKGCLMKKNEEDGSKSLFTGKEIKPDVEEKPKEKEIQKEPEEKKEQNNVPLSGQLQNDKNEDNSISDDSLSSESSLSN